MSPQDVKNLVQVAINEILHSKGIEIYGKGKPTPQSDELLTREETCKFLKIDSSTLLRWTNKGKVTAYGIGNHRYYKKAELLECLKPLK